MSISIGLLGEGYTVVASDCRTTNIKTNSHNDSAQKTFLYSKGWVSNSGGVGLETTFFKQNLNSHEIVTRNDIYNAWLYAIKQVESLAEKHVDSETVDMVKAELSSSQAVYSLNYIENGKAYMSVEAIDFAYKMRKIEGINSLIVSPPKGTNRIKKAIDKYTGIIKSTKSLYESIYLIACLVDDISKLSKWINNTIDYGISLQISENEIWLMNIRENAETLKSLYNTTGDYSEIMMVRNTIPRAKMLGDDIP